MAYPSARSLAIQSCSPESGSIDEQKEPAAALPEVGGENYVNTESNREH